MLYNSVRLTNWAEVEDP